MSIDVSKFKDPDFFTKMGFKAVYNPGGRKSIPIRFVPINCKKSASYQIVFQNSLIEAAGWKLYERINVYVKEDNRDTFWFEPSKTESGLLLRPLTNKTSYLYLNKFDMGQNRIHLTDKDYVHVKLRTKDFSGIFLRIPLAGLKSPPSAIERESNGKNKWATQI